MMIRYPLRDIQCDHVVAYCRRCGGEVYAEESIMSGCLCLDCWERERDAEN